MKPSESTADLIEQSYHQLYERLQLHSNPELSPLPPKLGSNASERLSAYLELLLRWNDTVDLVSPAHLNQLIDRHILDCLAFSFLAVADTERLLDVGSGAGLPGLVSAIVKPNAEVVLCEPRKKRCVFLAEARRVLGLSRVTVFEGRLEGLTDCAFSLITSRALGDDRLILQNARRLCPRGGRVTLMVGPSWQSAAGQVPGLQWRGLAEYSLPLEGACRMLAMWDVSRETPPADGR